MTRTPLLAATLALAVITTGCGEIRDLVSLPRLKAADMEPALTPQTSVILDANGNVITTFHGARNRTVVPIDRVRPHTRKAVIAIEDRRFYEHDGVDLRGIARAAVANFKMGGVAEGGSTITQQFVKNRIIAPEKGPVARSIKRKIREAALARQLEQKLSKKEILERYLNTIYFGNGAYGIQAAAKTYFDRPSHKLTLRQSALLAGLIKAPETYDPYDHPKRARKRRNLVLRNMEQVGFIAPKRRKAAASRKLNLNETPRKTEYPAPYFVDYVKRLLVFHPRFDFLGDSPAERSDRLYTGGLRIHTTLVPRHQQAAEHAIDKVLTEGSDPHASLVAMDPRDGKVKAIVGGRNFFAGKKKNKEFSKLNLAITARPDLGRSAGNNAAPGSGRQAGSAFKPFALAAALDDGISMTQRYNAPPCETFPKANDGKPWKVCNYGSSGYGQVDLREATTKSINVAYAKLVLEIGPRKVTRMARRLGIETPLQAVNSGALGTNPVSPLGMATAYATLANNGKRPEPIAITRIVDSTGKRLFKHETRVQRKADAAVAYTVNDALKDVIRDGTGTAARLGRPAAGKTGTAQEYRDAWFAGSVPQLTAAVWVGYPEASIEMKTSCGTRPSNECRPTRIQVSGGTWPAEIWREYMRTALARYPVQDFKKPKKGLERWTIDTRTGCRATFETPKRFKKKVLRVEDNSPAREKCRQLRDRFDDMGSATADSDGSSGAGDDNNTRERERNRDDDAGQSPSGGSGGSGEQDPIPQPEPEPEQSPTEDPSPEPEPEPEPTPTEEPTPEPTDVNEPTPGPSP